MKVKEIYNLMKQENLKVNLSTIKNIKQLNSLLKMQGVYISACTDYLYYKE